MKAIILAAGYATRLYPLTQNRPKGLLSIAGRPIMDWIADEIDTLDEVDETIVVSNHRFIRSFQAFARSRVRQGGRPVRVLDDGSMDDSDKLGAIGDIRFTLESLAIDDDVVIIAGDNLFTYALKDAADFFRRHGDDTILVKRVDSVDDLRRMANVEFTSDGIVTAMVEKPPEPRSPYAAFATYFYRRDTLPLVRQYLEEGNKPDAPGHFPAWLFRRKTVRAFVFDGECFDIGTPEAYRQVQSLFSPDRPPVADSHRQATRLEIDIGKG